MKFVDSKNNNFWKLKIFTYFLKFNDKKEIIIFITTLEYHFVLLLTSQCLWVFYDGKE